MIIREILQDPIAEVAKFDFFNDYKDTRLWLVEKGQTDVINLLDAANTIWAANYVKKMTTKSTA